MRPPSHRGHRQEAAAHSNPPWLWLSLCRGGGGTARGAHGASGARAGCGEAGRDPAATRPRAAAGRGLSSVERRRRVTRAALPPRLQDWPRVPWAWRARRRAQTGHAARVCPGPGHNGSGAGGPGCAPRRDAHLVHSDPGDGRPLWRGYPPRGRYAPPGTIWRPTGPRRSRPASCVGRVGAAAAVGGAPRHGGGAAGSVSGSAYGPDGRGRDRRSPVVSHRRGPHADARGAS